MKTTLLRVFIAILALPVFASAQSVIERLKELDRQRESGALSEAAYDQEWRRVLAEGMSAVSGSSGTYGSAHAAGRNTLDNNWEISFSGSWTNLDAADTKVGSMVVDFTLGRYVTDWLLVYATADYTRADSGAGDLNIYGAGGGVDFCLGDRSAGFVPYVGAGASWAEVDIDAFAKETDWAWDVHAGIRQNVGESFLIKYEVSYRSYDKVDLSGFAASIGVGLRF